LRFAFEVPKKVVSGQGQRQRLIAEFGMNSDLKQLARPVKLYR